MHAEAVCPAADAVAPTPLTRSLYEAVLDALPGWCDAFVTPERSLREQDLALMAGRGHVFAGAPREYSQAREQECHAVAAYAWLRNPGWQLVMGFAYSEELNEACSSWHFHSFCLDGRGRLVEPTPCARDRYWGSVLTEEEARECVREELENIRNLGLHLSPRMLARLECPGGGPEPK